MHPTYSGPAVDQRATEFRLHGPLTLVHDGISTEVPLGGPRELLAMLLLQRFRGSSGLDIEIAQDVLGYHPAMLRRAFAYARDDLNQLLRDTGLKVSASRSEIHLDGRGYRSDLDNLLHGFRSVEIADSVAEVLDMVDRAVDVGPGAPLEGLGGAYFRSIRDGFGKAWEAAAVGWLCAARVAGMPAPEVRFHALFIDKAPELESAMPTLARAADDALRRPFQDPRSAEIRAVVEGEQLVKLKAVIGGLVSEIRLQVSVGLREAREGVREADPNRNPQAPALSGRPLTLEVSIYLGDGQEHQAVEAAVEGLLAEADIVLRRNKPPEIGSWFRKFWARTTTETAHLSAEQIAAELERKIRIEVFDKAQAVIDNQQATGAAALIASLQGEQHACIRVGSLLVLKVDGQVLVNTLTQYQLAWLERNQVLLRDPAGLLRGLEKLTAEPQNTSGDQLPPSDLADIEIESSSP